VNGKKSKILYLVPTLMTGGLERMVYLLASQVDASRFSPEILVFDRWGAVAEEALAAGVPVTLDRRGPGFLDPGLLGRLATRLRRDPPALVHAHNCTALVYAAFAAKLAGGNVPVVYTEHDRSFPGRVPDRAMHIAAGRMVDKVVVVAQWLADALVKWERFPAERISVIPNGIEGQGFSGKYDIAAIRAELGVREGAPLASCVARLVAVKNHGALITAWRRIADVWPGATLLLVGDGDARPAVEEAVRKNGLQREVRLLGERSDVPRLLAASDFHVLASHSEGMSLTLLEAMAAGKASVATAVGGNPEVITDGRTGLLVAPGDVHALAAAMASLIQDPFTADDLGRRARARFSERFTLGAMIRSYEGVYDDTIAARSSDAIHAGQGAR
jgi:L-malate glycosyltransferase